MREIIRKILLNYGEFRDVDGEQVFTWKLDTPKYIKQIYKGLKKAKQLTINI